MQTFLPYEDFYECAAIIDKRRCVKQVVEGFQILDTLTGKSSGWRKHPAVAMWRGYEERLYSYVRAMIFGNPHAIVFDKAVDKLLEYKDLPYCDNPPWLGGKIHETHRANLWRKGFQESIVFHLKFNPFVSGKRYGYGEYIMQMGALERCIPALESYNWYRDFGYSFHKYWEWDIDYFWPTK